MINSRRRTAVWFPPAPMSSPAFSRALPAVRVGLAPRTFHTSSPASASVVASPAASTHHGPILDIFDAPVRLGSYRPALERRTPTSRPLMPTPRVAPLPLPPPILFDGPAQPHNLPLQLQGQRRSSRPRAQKPHLSTPQPTTHMKTSEPLIQLFDGPARITRCMPTPVKGVRQNSFSVLGSHSYCFIGSRPRR